MRVDIDRLRRARRRLARSWDVERFVQLIVAGGLALLAGLWVVRVTPQWSLGWVLGIGLVCLGSLGLARGIQRELTPDF